LQTPSAEPVNTRKETEAALVNGAEQDRSGGRFARAVGGCQSHRMRFHQPRIESGLQTLLELTDRVGVEVFPVQRGQLVFLAKIGNGHDDHGCAGIIPLFRA